MIGAREILTPLFHRFDNRQKVLMICVNVLFCSDPYLGIYIGWWNIPDSVVLLDDASDLEAPTIVVQTATILTVEMLENSCIGEVLCKPSK